MKRVLMIVLLGIACFAAAQCRAEAMTELCPANLQIAPIHEPDAKTLKSDIFAMQLTAPTPRTVAGRIAFYTDSGWYSMVLPVQHLRPRTRPVAGTFSNGNFTDAAAPTLFAKFPGALVVKYAFLTDVVTDAPIWSNSQTNTCWGGSPPHPKPESNKFVASYFPGDEWANAPETAQNTFLAAPGPALGNTSCANPFQDAVATFVVTPDFPASANGIDGQAEAVIKVQLDETGAVRDASVYYSSGYLVDDAAARRAAISSAYRPRISFCKPIASEYLFAVWFNNA